MLYRINMSRFKNSDGNYGFIVDYECREVLSETGGLLKLGGEGKSFVYGHSNFDINLLSSHLESVKTAIQSTSRFKLYFATPTIFQQGWLPSWLIAIRFRVSIRCTVRRILNSSYTAAVGKPISVGGWNMAKGEAKPTHRAVPAGSVYYFELSDGNRIDDLIAAFHYKNISDERSEEGFGLALIGIAKGEIHENACNTSRYIAVYELS